MADNDQNDSQTNSQASEPSLLERQSRGGDIGEGGINFQADVVLSMIPRWLRMEGFTSMVRESMGDAEAKFFAPGRGYKKEFIEVKDHLINPAEFWHEVERFKQMERAVGGEFQWFTLALAGLHKDLHPLINNLRRIRDPYDFYEDSQIFKNSYDDYLARVTGLDKTDEDADFLFRKVLILGDLSVARDSGRALFKQSLTENLQYHRDLPTEFWKKSTQNFRLLSEAGAIKPSRAMKSKRACAPAFQRNLSHRLSRFTFIRQSII